MKMDGYDDCVLGLLYRYGLDEPILVYDRDKVLAKLQQDGMTYEEAEEFHEYNQLGAWVGDTTPAFLDTSADLSDYLDIKGPPASPEFEADGYPTDRTLRTIEAWTIRTPEDYRAFRKFCEAGIRPPYGVVRDTTDRGKRARKMATGGWSGNESIMNAMLRNPVFHMIGYIYQRRGGVLVYYTQAIKESA